MQTCRQTCRKTEKQAGFIHPEENWCYELKSFKMRYQMHSLIHFTENSAKNVFDKFGEKINLQEYRFTLVHIEDPFP